MKRSLILLLTIAAVASLLPAQRGIRRSERTAGTPSPLAGTLGATSTVKPSGAVESRLQRQAIMKFMKVLKAGQSAERRAGQQRGRRNVGGRGLGGAGGLGRLR